MPRRRPPRKGQPGYLRDGDPDDEGNPTAMTRAGAVTKAPSACIFPEPAWIRRRRRVRAACRSRCPRRTNDGLEAAGVLASPLRLEHSSDESGHVTSRLREWKRRDWGTGGEDFGWWCTEEPEAFVGGEPLYRSARDEIVELSRRADLRPNGPTAGADRVGAAGASRREALRSRPRTAKRNYSSSSSSNSTPYLAASSAYSSSPDDSVVMDPTSSRPPRPRSNAPGPDCLSFLASSKRR